jgi:tRNA dimethylallyltransferase
MYAMPFVYERGRAGARGVTQQRDALIVAGPTCSGKSALALAIAQRVGGTVINVDSMQVYRELHIVTARPTPEEEALVPHRLYGVRPAAEPGSMAWWRGEALQEMAESPGLPILCGGTGLYLDALVRGIADIPEPDAASREEARSLLAEEGAAALHARLAAVDPETAAQLKPNDSQRVARAWEVWRSTGQGLTAWQRTAHAPADWQFRAIVIDPPRDQLRAAISTRFDAMVEQGAIEEVAALLEQHLDPALPAMRAHGVPELAAYLRGETSLEAAKTHVKLVTGQYTKRQATWLRNRPPVGNRDDFESGQTRLHTIHARIAGLEQFSESRQAEIFNFIRAGG